jgi:hypothetical protein
MLLCSSITETLPNRGFLLRNCNEPITGSDECQIVLTGGESGSAHGVGQLKVVHLDASAAAVA